MFYQSEAWSAPINDLEPTSAVLGSGPCPISPVEHSYSPAPLQPPFAVSLLTSSLLDRSELQPMANRTTPRRFSARSTKLTSAAAEPFMSTPAATASAR